MQRLSALQRGEVVNIRAYDLPGWARVGQQCVNRRAIVSADNRVTFTVETAAQVLADLGL